MPRAAAMAVVAKMAEAADAIHSPPQSGAGALIAQPLSCYWQKQQVFSLT